MDPGYVWDGKQVHVIPDMDAEGQLGVITEGFRNVFVLDTRYTDPVHRYVFVGADSVHCATSVPYEVFPKEFLTHLLLLGVAP